MSMMDSVIFPVKIIHVYINFIYHLRGPWNEKSRLVRVRCGFLLLTLCNPNLSGFLLINEPHCYKI